MLASVQIVLAIAFSEGQELCVKAAAHPKIQIQLLSTHLNANGKYGDVSKSTKHFWSWTAKQHCSIYININRSRG